MKLIYCPACHDVFKLSKRSRPCNCGKIAGHYNADGDTATVYGKAVVLGILNGEFRAMLTCSDCDGVKMFLYPMDNGKITVLRGPTGG